MQLYYVECGTEFTNTFGDIDMKFYDSLCRVYHGVTAAVAECSTDRLYQRFGERLKSVVHDSAGIGWGYHDYLVEEYHTIPWMEDE